MLTPLAIAVGGAAVWFSGLQLLVIRRICAFCMFIQVIGVGLLFQIGAM